VQLPGRARVLRFDIQVPVLLAAPHVPDPVAAAATLKTRRTTFTPGPAQGAAAATAPSEQVTPPHCFAWLGIPWHGLFHLSLHGRYVASPLAWSEVGLAESGPRRALPTAQSVSRIWATSAALARVKRLAISAAVTGSFTPAKAPLTALTRSDNVLGQGNLRRGLRAEC
jgi:hypothetical protein